MPAEFERKRGDPDRLAEFRNTMAGMVAVGVSFSEALMGMRPHLKDIGIRELVRLSGELARSGLDRVKGLYEFQKTYQNKRLFAQVCVEEGLHPAGVALAAIVMDENRDATPESLAKAKGLIRTFGVDSYLADNLTEELLELHVEDPFMGKDLILHVPFDCTFRGERPGSGEALLRGLGSVGGDLYLHCALSMRDPGMKKTFLSLAEVSGNLILQECQNMTYPALRDIGGELSLRGAVGVEMPALEVVGGGVDLHGARNVACPNLRKALDAHLPGGLFMGPKGEFRVS